MHGGSVQVDEINKSLPDGDFHYRLQLSVKPEGKKATKKFQVSELGLTTPRFTIRRSSKR